MKKLRVLTAALVLLVLPVVASAAPITFLQFTQAQLGNNFVVTSNGVTSTITSTQEINVTFDQSTCLVAGCGGVTSGIYDLVLTANSTSPATSDGSDISQNFSGTIAITDGAVNLLTVNFSDIFTGAINGSTPTLSSSQPPDLFTGSSTVIDPLKLGIPRGFSISFSSFTCTGGGGLQIVGSSICSATAAGTGTFSADVVPLVTPEPATMALFGLGLVGIARRFRRR
jgi:hypothetical protein